MTKLFVTKGRMKSKVKTILNFLACSFSEDTYKTVIIKQ